MSRQVARVGSDPGCRGVRRAPALVLILAALAAPAAAGPSLVAGVERYMGAEQQRTDAALAALAWTMGSGSAFLGGLGFDDRDAGKGWGYLGGGDLPLGDPVLLRFSGARFAAGDSYRASRIKAGPVLRTDGDAEVGLSFMREENRLVGRTDALWGETSWPIASRWRGRAGLGLARHREAEGLQARLGAAWLPVAALEISGELSAAEAAVAGSQQAFPATRRVTDGLPLLGRDDSAGTAAEGEGRPVVWGALLGVKVSFP